MINDGLTLGGLLDCLKSKPQEYFVYFDFANLVPTDLGSYRGFYEDLALGFSDIEERRTVEQLTQQLKDALKESFCGYKGGNYKMTRKSTLWVANYSHTTNTYIRDVVLGEDERVLLLTGRQEV